MRTFYSALECKNPKSSGISGFPSSTGESFSSGSVRDARTVYISDQNMSISVFLCVCVVHCKNQ